MLLYSLYICHYDYQVLLICLAGCVYSCYNTDMICIVKSQCCCYLLLLHFENFLLYSIIYKGTLDAATAADARTASAV
jgi:hypothetical protein